MARNWSPSLEPETLAFPIKPQKNEAFDSWLDRLTAAHGVSRVQLFHHLEIDPGLANLDLVRGKGGLNSPLHPAFDAMVIRLAWAVQVEIAQITETFLGCEAVTLLPRRHRRYACAQCWYDAQRMVQPLIVCRDWILRASWRCAKHGLPLTDMRIIPPEAAGWQLTAKLARGAMRSRRIQWKIKPAPGALARNKAVVDYLMGPADWEGLAPPYKAYQIRFAANQYHLAVDRIAMLALAHSNASKSARRFERMIAERLPERPKPEGGTVRSARGPLRRRTCRLPKPRAQWAASDLTSLLIAYAEVRQRREREHQLEAIFARRG